MMIAKMTTAGWSSTASPWIFGHEEVVLDLLDERVQDERGDDGLGPGGGREQDRRDAEMIGPMIGTSSRTPAMTDSRIAYRPKIGSTRSLRMIRPMNVKMPTAKPRIDLRRGPTGRSRARRSG